MKTPDLVRSPGEMCGLILHPVDRHIIVTKAVMPLAQIIEKFAEIEGLALVFSLVTKHEPEAQGWKMRV